MTCIPFNTRGSRGFICVNYWGRLHVGDKYIWVSFHQYCGPSFFTDADMSKPYWPEDENDPVWPEFAKWMEKYEAQKAKAKAVNARSL